MKKYLYSINSYRNFIVLSNYDSLTTIIKLRKEKFILADMSIEYKENISNFELSEEGLKTLKKMDNFIILK